VRASWLLAAAGLFSASAAGLVFLRLSDSTKVTTIVVASRPIQAGQLIEANQLAEIAWAAEALPAGTFGSRQAVSGRVAATAIAAKRPVFDSDLVAKGTVAGLDALIAPGSRAVSLDASTVSGIGPHIRAGSSVDVIVAGRDQADQPFSKIVVQHVRVLSVEAPTKPGSSPAKPLSLTLELDPAQAERIDLSRSIGKLSMVLRNQFDAAAVPSRGARMADLTASPAGPPQQPEPRALSSIPVVRTYPAKARDVALTSRVEQIRGTGAQVER
jgi:pilus assembly protein CpaB